MNELVFLDTSGWLAAVNPKESFHKAALADFESLVDSRTRFLTSNLVLAEMHALLTREQGASAGIRLIDAIYTDPLYRVVAVDRDLESEAVDNWLRRMPDVRLSLTDAVSFQLMKEEGIRTAFTLDAHFAAAGFQLLPQRHQARRRKP